MKSIAITARGGANPPPQMIQTISVRTELMKSA